MQLVLIVDASATNLYFLFIFISVTTMDLDGSEPEELLSRKET